MVICPLNILSGFNDFYLHCLFICVSFYATYQDNVTNYSFEWAIILLHFILRFVTCLLFMFTTFSPSHCAMCPSRGFLTSIVLREGKVSVSFSKACRLAMGHTQPPGAHSDWEGEMLKLTIHFHLQLRLAQAQACTWTAFLWGSYVQFCSHVPFSPHSI
jgi:hypothetical protein